MAASLSTSDTCQADQHEASRLLGGYARFVAQGATCTVYTDGRRVVRFSDPNPGKEARFRVDAQVRSKLLDAGVKTPRTQDLGTLPGGRTYSIENLIRADDSVPSEAGWQDLAQALRVLHGLPYQGYGLLQDRTDLLAGQCLQPADGFTSRLQQAWPFIEQPLTAQPLIWAAPELSRPLSQLEGSLRALTDLPAAVCHTDLHVNQLLWQEGRLAALLDFGDASIGPAAWDWASLAYFHGWDRAAQVAGQSLTHDAALFGLLIAFHRASRAVTLNRPQRTAEAVAFAWSCLKRL